MSHFSGNFNLSDSATKCHPLSSMCHTFDEPPTKHGNHTTIKIVRLSVPVGDRGKRRAARGWLAVLGVVDTRFGVSQPAADAER